MCFHQRRHRLCSCEPLCCSLYFVPSKRQYGEVPNSVHGEGDHPNPKYLHGKKFVMFGLLFLWFAVNWEAMILRSVDGPNVDGNIGRWTLFHKCKPWLGLNSASSWSCWRKIDFFSSYLDNDDLSKLRAILFEEGGIDTNLDCHSPSSSSNPTTIDRNWKRRRDEKDQKLLEDNSPTETSVCITIGCD